MAAAFTSWHRLPGPAVLDRLGSSSAGLAPEEVRRRLGAHGPNEIGARRPRTAARVLLRQFTDVLMVVLLAAAVVAGLLGDLLDALAIVAILILNAFVGFVQEYRAERALQALRALAAPAATVRRGGQVLSVPARELVVGDLVLLEAGRVVPADVRLLEVASLRVDEAVLTGESVPVEKTAAPLEDDPPLPADRRNMAWAGTVVTYGRGVGVVVATGERTEFGRIAAFLRQAEEPRTPLQRRLAHFGRRLGVVVLALCALLFAVGLLRGEPPLLVFLTALSLAVAAVPEALPAVITVSLALGARAMAARRALVRRLAAVEALGSVTYICADKTGTLTQNRMRAEAFYADGELRTRPGASRPWTELLRAMALCNDAVQDGPGRASGDPTEVALLEAALQAGVSRSDEERARPRVAEVPFDAERKLMTTVHRDPEHGYVSVTKGAPEAVLGRATAVLTARGPEPLRTAELLEVGERLAAEGFRVLALGVRVWGRELPPRATDALEQDLTVLGLVALADPPREEVEEAIAACREAGIVPVMITGDHPATARAVARRLGILGAHADGLLTGPELAALSPDELRARTGEVRVYARVAPEQKLAIVQALQARGEVVAVTGDGVNDAPALRQADIGVAMGIAGTDVAREASAMVLLDDNFATIVRAVREGRRIYDNLRRFIRYVLTTNAAEVWTVMVAPAVGLPMPLLPLQILWINLVTDGLPGLALAAEREEPDVMRRPPRPRGESVFAHGLGAHVLWVGVLMAGLTLGIQASFLAMGSTRWQTLTFTVLCFCQLAHVLAIRSERTALLRLGLRSNPALLLAVGLTCLLQLAVVYMPPLQRVFHTEPLRVGELALALGVPLVVILAVEVEKWARRRGAGTVRAP